jgi:hypothetical protein
MGCRTRVTAVACLACVLAGWLLAACGAAHPKSSGAPQPSGGALAYAESLLGGAKVPSPSLFQQSLLKHEPLTYADYDSAMQAMAQCVEERAPGTTVTLTPGQLQPETLSVTVSYGGGTASQPQTGGSNPSGSGSSSSPAPGPDASSGPPLGSSSMPASAGNVRKALGWCMAAYSAYVASRWQAQLVLSPSQASEQRPQFETCMRNAGVTLPDNPTNADLKRLLQTPGWGQTLTPQQSTQATRCIEKYAAFVATITQ